MSKRVSLKLPELRAAYPGLALFVDVAKWQKDIDWAQLSKYVDGVIVKTTGVLETGVCHIDGKAQRNIAQATATGRVVGAYHYARQVLPSGAPAPSAATQATYFVAQTKRIYAAAKVPFAPAFMCLDLEPGELRDARDSGWSPARIERWVKDFMYTLINLVPASTRCEIYHSGACIGAADGGLDFLRDDPRFEGWLAGYPTGGPRADGFPAKPLGLPDGWTWGAWQFSSDGSSPGVKGEIDLNVCRPGSIFERVMLGGRAPSAPSAIGAPLAFLLLALFVWFYKPARQRLQTAARSIRRRLAA